MHVSVPLRLMCVVASICTLPCFSAQPSGGGETDENGPLIVVAIGDVGDGGSDWRANGFYLSDMFTGRHNGGKPDALIFLGDNFLPLGLNIPAADVEGEVQDLFRPLQEMMRGTPRDRVHAIPGEFDYYSRFAEEKTAFFGLIKTGEGPTGLSDKGNTREAAINAWTYHSGLPGQAILPLAAGSPDSVQFIFLDSALPLRTDPSRWHDALEKFRRLLDASKDRTSIAWRVLCAHHPWYSVGVHGGYSLWDDEQNAVVYLTNCDRDSNATGFVRNWIDPEDLCADKYRQYVDSIRSVIRLSSVKIQFMLGAHDRSLQILSYPQRDPDCGDCPKVQIISGAGSLPTRVKLPSPPTEFTSAGHDAHDEGISPPGFVQLRFDRNHVRVVFYNARNGNPIDMGDGHTVFEIDRLGQMMTE